MLKLKNTMIEFDYVNWRGEKSRRTAMVENVWYGSNEYHKEDQWLLEATDRDKQEIRLFAMKDMSNIKYW
ncbi:hypothetical protein BEH_07510 [Priestia filamentosa]|uniref:Uncharacterized protein n=1 Tax=Priestia filamentosa TaxID=1402861 RepID=A0A0H4KPZ4_9BACI|nr:hypothetical protein [Priestia filamentosa]AKO95006.1 hypothetical protein BEH_07510 [Priestia filamentosa]